MPGLAPLSAGITLASRTDINRKEAYLRSSHSLKKLRKPSRWYILGIATMPTKNRSRVCPITSWHLSPMAAELRWTCVSIPTGRPWRGSLVVGLATGFLVGWMLARGD